MKGCRRRLSSWMEAIALVIKAWSGLKADTASNCNSVTNQKMRQEKAVGAFAN